MKELAYLNKFFYKYRFQLLLGTVFVILSNYFRILQPQVIREAMDLVADNIKFYYLYENSPEQELLRQDLSQSLLYFGLLTLIFALLMGLFMYFMRQTIIVVSRRIEYDLRNEIFKQYEKLDIAFYKRNKTGDLMARITEDVNKVRMYLGPALMYGINLVLLCVMVIYAMIQVSAELTFYALLPLPLLSASIYYVNRIINRKSSEIQAQLSELNNLAQEAFSGVRVVKAYAREASINAHFGQACEVYKQKNLSLARVDAIFRPLMLLLVGLSTVIALLVGGQLVIQGSITVGNIAEFIIYINMLTWPVTSIGWVASIVQQASASQKRINEFLKQSSSIKDQGELSNRDLQGHIEFKNIDFTYPDTGIKALENVSFRLKAGQTLAIVGATGSGKTTICDLLLRLYEPEKGEILLDHQALANYDLASLRRAMAYVPQDVFLFSDSIHNNIAFSSEKEVPRDLVRQQAEYACVETEIEALPQGFDTIIGERGVTLSGGQKQRLSIARALMTQAPILLFDDCLSAVDSHTEARISQFLREVAADKTTIIVTNRLYGALRFDYVLVLDQGRVLEQGRPEELLEQGGAYAQLYEQQRQQFSEVDLAQED